MTQPPPSGMPIGSFEIDLPPEHETGVPADFASVWHTPSIFVLDFIAVKTPGEIRVDPATGAQTAVMPGRIVSRVRIPPEQVFELARVLTQQLDMWEQETGKAPPQGPAA